MTAIRKVRKIKKVALDEDGIVGTSLQNVMHDAPMEVHNDRAAEAIGMDRALLPIFGTVAELLAFVLTVKAAGGQDVAIKEILDRFTPKAGRPVAQVDLNVGGAAPPMASKNTEEQAAATNYMDSLKLVKK